MSLDLLNELEKRVQSAVDTIETLKLEIEELKEDNAQLQDDNAQLQEEKTAWESRLGDLLGKFDLLEGEDTSEGSAVDDVAEDSIVEDDAAEESIASTASSEGELMDQSRAEEALIEQDSALDELDDLDDLTAEEEAELEAQTAPSSPFNNL